EPLAWVRGPGSNSHGPGGAAGCVEVIAALVERAAPELPIEHGAFFLCGADVPQDHAELRAELEARAWVRELELDNDTFALLHAGTDRPDAVAVVCGAGINRVGRRADGRIARYPALGWETGDWGGGEGLGRAARRARACDRRRGARRRRRRAAARRAARGRDRAARAADDARPRARRSGCGARRGRARRRGRPLRARRRTAARRRPADPADAPACCRGRPRRARRRPRGGARRAAAAAPRLPRRP